MRLFAGCNWNIPVSGVYVKYRYLSARWCDSDEEEALREYTPFAWKFNGIDFGIDRELAGMISREGKVLYNSKGGTVPLGNDT